MQAKQANSAISNESACFFIQKCMANRTNRLCHTIFFAFFSILKAKTKGKRTETLILFHSIDLKGGAGVMEQGKDSSSESAVMTMERIEEFLEDMARRDCRPGSMKKYERNLRALYAFLPEDKRIDRETMSLWRTDLLERGYAARTVNSCLSVGNQYMEYIQQANWREKDFLPVEASLQPELSRSEYKRLLQTAKLLGKERLYFTIKVLGSMGLKVHELPEVTRESLFSGRILLRERKVRFPPLLRQELEEYAERHGIRAGPVFLTRNGVPPDRTQVWTEIRKLCQDARVPEEKANPRCLRNLYQSTQESIRSSISILIEQAYDRLLEEEQDSVGWEVKLSGK